MKNNNVYNEIKAAIIILIIVTLVCLFVIFAKICFQVVLCFLLFYIFVYFVNQKMNFKIFKKISHVLSFALVPLYILSVIGYLFGFLIFYLFCYFIIPYLFILALSSFLFYFHVIDFLKHATLIYLQFTIGVFSVVVLNPFIRELIFFPSVSFSRSIIINIPIDFERLTNYILSIENVKFFIYFIYVFALLATNYCFFEGLSFYNSSEYDRAILQSFVTFIAFDRAFTILKQIEITPARFLKKIIDMIINILKNESDILKKNMK